MGVELDVKVGCALCEPEKMGDEFKGPDVVTRDFDSRIVSAVHLE